VGVEDIVGGFTEERLGTSEDGDTLRLEELTTPPDCMPLCPNVPAPLVEAGGTIPDPT